MIFLQIDQIVNVISIKIFYVFEIYEIHLCGVYSTIYIKVVNGLGWVGSTHFYLAHGHNGLDIVDY